MDVKPHLLNLSAYINQNLEKDLPLSSLAKRVGLSPFHFHRKFGAYFGESLHQHIKRLRLERAAYSLSYGSKPVRDIARESGYKTVSAFSHAFSGFAGQSPTRYRSRGALNGTNGSAHEDQPQTASAVASKPAWVGTLPELSFAFVRAQAEGRGRQAMVEKAMDVVKTTLGPSASAKADGAADAQAGDPREFIWATTDLYGIAKGGSYRIDVGVDARVVPAARTGAFGVQSLPGGRYARFDLECTVDDLIEQVNESCLYGLAGTAETPGPTPCFLRFTDDANTQDGGESRSYRLFVPLAGKLT